MKDTVVVDIDGTLADISHRVHLIRNKPKQWNKFFEECDKDTPNDWCVKLVRSMHDAGYLIHFVTGRKKALEAKTQAWLSYQFRELMGVRSSVPYKLTLVRGNGDFTPDFELKRKWLFVYGKDRILFVVEDRDQVVKMYREEGLTVLQCADGNY